MNFCGAKSRRDETERWQEARPAWSSPMNVQDNVVNEQRNISHRHLKQAVRTALARGRVWFRGRVCSGDDAVASLCKKAFASGRTIRPSLLALCSSIPTRRGFVKARSYNAETMLVAGRLDEVLRVAAHCSVDVLVAQGTMLSIEKPWESEHYTIPDTSI